MPFEVAAAVIGVAGSVYAADQQSKSNSEAADRADPFYPYRQQYATQLNSLMADPSSVKNTPGYQFQFDQGVQAITRSGAAAGQLGSGNMGTALMKYGSDYASSNWMQYAQFLSHLAGADMGANQSAMVQGNANQYQANMNSLSNLGYAMGQFSGSGAGSSGEYGGGWGGPASGGM